jgi:GTP-binding protein YchF
MPRLGIVGFANSGKTTLFNALTGMDLATAPHPFSTFAPNVGVAKVPDARLDDIAKLEGSTTVVYATLELVDFPPLGRLGKQSGPSGEFLGKLREVDALALVLRAFHDEAVAADESGTDPIAQAEELLLELAVADHDIFARKMERITKEATADKSRQAHATAIVQATQLLAGGEGLRSLEWEDVALGAFRDLAPLTLKPVVWVINVDESEASVDKLISDLATVVPKGDSVIAVSAKLEAEGALLAPDERRDLFLGLGLGEGALAAMVRATYHSLGLISFYTIGPKESRAWTVSAGATAPEAAGKVHSDLERGFIRAEVAPLERVIAAGGWEAAKKAGEVRVEGKTYTVAANDVLLIRFSV